VTFAGILEAFGDVLLEKWGLANKNIFLIIGMGIYFVSTLLWAHSLKYEYLSKAISIITVLNLLIVVLVGVLYFKESLTLINKIGILCAIVAIFLIEQ
jgi:multidrug transporter EmrE-like cation transporter